jgi:hypothetical protein
MPRKEKLTSKVSPVSASSSKVILGSVSVGASPIMRRPKIISDPQSALKPFDIFQRSPALLTIWRENLA